MGRHKAGLTQEIVDYFGTQFDDHNRARTGGRDRRFFAYRASVAVRLAAEGHNLVAVGRRRDRLEELAAALPDVSVRPVVADLGTDAGAEAVANICATEPVTMLVNNAGVAHYMAFANLPPDKASGLVHVKVVAYVGAAGWGARTSRASSDRVRSKRN